MAKENKSLSIVFPAYNEEKNIKKTVKDAYKYAEKNFKNFEIIVVDDGSSDSTAEIVKEITKQKRRVKLLQNSKNMGYGATVWKGLKVAKKQLIFFSDADRQFDLKEISKILRHAEDFDVIIGYRSHRKDPWNRKLNAFGWKLVIHLMLNLKVRDIDCAFKLFNKKVIDSLKVKSVGATFSAELIYQIKKFGYKIMEVPVSHFPRLEGKPTGAKLSVIKKAFVELWNFYKKEEQLVNSRSKLVYSLGIVALFLSRLLFLSNSSDFFDSNEYIWRTESGSLINALATGHPPYHPLYVFFSWLLHKAKIGLNGIGSLELTSALLGSLGIVFLFLLIKKIFGSRIAWLATIIFSIIPFVWISQTTVLVDASEHVFYFLSLLLWLYALEARKLKGRILALLAGLSMGLAAFSHTQVAIWGLAVLAMPAIALKDFKKETVIDLIYKLILFGLGGAVFIYLYLELLIYSSKIGWFDSTGTYRAALKYLLFGNVGDHDAIELKKVVYYLLALSSTLVAGLGLLGILKIFVKEKRKFVFLALWFLPFFIGSTYIYENLYARTLIIGLVPVAIAAAYFILELKKFRALLVTLVIAQLLVLSLPAVYRYKVLPSPNEHLKIFVSDLKSGGIFISSLVTKTWANSAYNGEFVDFGDVGFGAGYVEDKVKEALSADKPAYVLSDALIHNYRRYDGHYYDLRSLGVGNAASHGSGLENIFRNFSLTLSKVEDFGFRRSVYEISESQSENHLQAIDRAIDKKPVMFGRLTSADEAVSGAIINNYKKHYCGTVGENITRYDLGFCLVRLLREEAEDWTFTDKDGWFYLATQTEDPKLVLGISPGQTRVKSLKGEFASEKIITPQAKLEKEFTDLGELNNRISESSGSFYVVASNSEGKKTYKLYRFDFELPKTNRIYAGNIAAEAGKVDRDSKSSSKVRVSDEREGFLVSGPYIDLEKGKYKVKFSIRTSKLDDETIKFDVQSGFGRETVAEKELNKRELSKDRFEIVELPFELNNKSTGMEFRVKTGSFSGVRVEFVELEKN